MRVAVLGAAGAALLGATLAITPLATDGTPAQGSMACTGASCERLASVLVPQTGPSAPALAAPPAPAPAPAPAPPAPLLGQPAVARVIAPGLAAPPPSATVPRLGAPGAPGQPGAVIPGTDIPISPDLLNAGYSIVNSLVAAQSSQAAGSIIGGVVGGASGLVAAVASLGGSGVNVVALLNELNRLNSTGDLTTAKVVSLLIPQVGVLEQLDPQLTAQLNSINLAKLTSIPAIQAALPALRNLPPPALPSPEQAVAVLRTLPPPQLPPLPPPPVICGPWIGFWQPCI